MYTPPLDVLPVPPAPSAPPEKSRDNGFTDLLRDNSARDHAGAKRADGHLRREPGLHDFGPDESRPREAGPEDSGPRDSGKDRRVAADDTRPARARRDSEAPDDIPARTEDTRPANESAATDADIPAGPEKPRADHAAQPDEASDTASDPASRAAIPAPFDGTGTIAPGHTTRTVTGEVPGYQQIVESAANTPPAGIVSDLPGTPTKVVEATATEGMTAADGDTLALLSSGTEPAAGDRPDAAAPKPAGNQPGAPTPGEALQPIPPARTAENIAMTTAETSPPNSTANAAASPLAAVAVKPVAGGREASSPATSPPPGTPAAATDAAMKPVLPSQAEAEGDFETELTAFQTKQGARPDAGQAGATANAATAGTVKPDTGGTPGKAAELLPAGGDMMPRNAEPLPQAATPGTAQSPTLAAATGSEMRVISDASPLAETAAARTTPNAAASQIAVQINRAVVDGQDKIMINLKPAALGRVSVNLEVGHDKRIIAIISVERPETLDLLQRDARTLERALQEAGLKTDAGSLSFNLQGEGPSDGPFDDFADNGPFAAVPILDGDEAIADSTTAAYAMSASGVDIHV